MTKTKFNNKSKCLKLGALLMFPMALFGGVTLSQSALNERADALSAGYANSHNASVTLTNDSFQNGNKPYTSGTSLSGWNAIETNSRATGMIIDVGSGEMSEGESGTTATFSKYKDTYMLNSNPECKDSSDSRVLMINSKASLDQSRIDARKGYRSSSITLSANSYYSFKVSARTLLNGDDYVSASIYLSGLKDVDGKNMQIGIENVSPSSWTDYYMFVATGNKEQTVTLDLYLGSANGGKSQGAVFFDDCHIERYSENLFYSVAKNHGYDFSDNADSLSNDTVFLVQGLKTLPSFIDNFNSYNFDFEDNASVGGLSTWSEIKKSNAHAQIMGITDMQPADFKSTTRFDYVGHNLGYENDNALVMWTGASNEYKTNYIGLKSSDIQINAHTAYKVSLKLKIAGMEEGSFVLKVTENDSIYSLYPSVFAEDEDAENYYQLKNGQTNGYSTNTDNDWTNDYQTVEFCIKGYDLYNTSVNLELWLGDESTTANGCVIVDDIVVEKSTSAEFLNATNKLELKAYSGSTSGFTNPLFNATEYSNVEMKYPLTATGWTSEVENETYNESGVIYLGKDDEYKSMYSGKYDWAGISPKTKDKVTNNVYMMFNRQNSYQSLKSSSYSISKNSYYKISFDYYNQLYSTLNNSSIKVEVIDKNGIVLFSQDGLSSLDNWDTMEIYLHTAQMVAHEVNVVVHLGENQEGKKVGGYVYLDNFAIESSNEADFLAGKFNTDLSDYFLSLETNGIISKELSNSPAFDFKVNEVYDKGYQGSESEAVGGVVNGQDNHYGITTDKSNFLVLSTKVASKASLTSKYSFAFEADTYYKLTFDLATIFDDSNLDTDKNYNYGVSIEMKGFDAVSNLIASEKLKSYTIYFKCDTATDASFTFSLISDCEETLGTALLTNFDIQTSNNDEFTSASVMPGYKDSVFTAKQTETPAEDENEDTSTDTTTDDNSKWLLIPSIIMGVALIVAIIGFALRKVKIKKIDKIKKENYDRKLSLNHDVITAEARKRRDNEVANLQDAKRKLEDDKARIEAEHKEYVRTSREQSNGKLTREIEKAFKKYNSNIARINEKINIVKEKIDNVMSAEYLLSLEHKIVVEEENKFAKTKSANRQSNSQQD